MLRAYVFARHKFHTVELHAVGSLDHIAELYKRVSPITRKEDVRTIVVEPFLAEQVGGLFVFFAVFSHKSVLVALDHSHTLRDTAL